MKRWLDIDVFAVGFLHPKGGEQTEVRDGEKFIKHCGEIQLF